MKKNLLEDTGIIWQKADWYRAVTLIERKASLQAFMNALTEKNEWNSDKAEQQLQQWKTQAPYTKGMSFAERLALDSLTENDLLTLFAEPIEALQARLPLPDWLGELRLAFEDPSASPAYPLPIQNADGSRSSQAFLNAIQPLLKRGIQRLAAGLHDLAQQHTHLPFDQQTIISLLSANLSQQLLSASIRTFALEMNVARVQGRLQGETPEERFESFVQHLSSPEGSLPFLEEYVVLTRHFIISINQWVNFSLELLSHLCADWEHIRAVFCPETEPGLLVEVRAGAGDTHRGGRSVATLKFRSGFQLIYKPHSLAVDLHFQELLCWLNTRGSHPPFRIFNIIDRGNYGWSAFVEARECRSEEEVQRFYERQGAYLALLYLLDATDLHAENVIALGEYPILIDLEALFHPQIEDPLHGKEPAFAALGHSVMRVGLLPQYIWGNEDARGIDLSGLGGEKGQLTPRPVPRWENEGTDQMRLVRTRIEITTSKNRPTLKGKPVDTLSYCDHILAGFNSMYQTLLNHRDALLADVLPRFAQDKIRFIARPTDIYARFLYDSFRPELLRDALERERHFDRLWIGIERQPYGGRIIPAERSDLLRGDIPIFTTRPTCQDLFTSQGEVIPAFFAQTSMDRLRERVQQLGEQDRQRQLWIINASFTGIAWDARRSHEPPRQSQPAQTEVTRSRLLAAARAIGDDLCQRAIQDNDCAGWLSISQVREQEWEVKAAGLDLYKGLPGITLFLAYLAELTGEARYLDLARAALSNIQRLLQHPQWWQLLPGIGAFDGWGGLIYLFAHLGTLWHEPALFQQAEEVRKLLQDMIEHDDAFDIIAGSAGCLAALLSFHEAVPAAHVLDTAIACGDHLLAHACPMQVGLGWKLRRQDTPLTGMAHGNAGIAFSLLRLAEKSGAERFRQAAFAAIAYERHLFSSERQNWPDLRKRHDGSGSKQPGSPEGEYFMVAWCHGAPGIALARMGSPRFAEDEAIDEEIEHALATTITAGEKIGSDPTLCHGAAGLLETFLTAREVLSPNDYAPHIERLTHRLLAVLEAKICQNEYQMAPWWAKVPGLMIGLAGIGYTFLRLVDPLHVPSVLTLADPHF